MAFAGEATNVDHKGFLLKRGANNSTFRQRWFILKGNVLFYFKTAQDLTPVGFILLEGSTVKPAPATEEVAWAFTIQFGGQSRSYVLIAMDKYVFFLEFKCIFM